MSKPRTLEDFYQSKFNWVPEELKKGIGHFNVFRVEEFFGNQSKPIPYSRRDYYKISLVIGKKRIHYADKVIKVDKQAILFSNPLIPYSWEALDGPQSGYICVFTPAFFQNFGNLKKYGILQPNGTPVLELSDQQSTFLKTLYERMFEEINSDYTHKYDVLRNLVFEILHYVMKLQPAENVRQPDTNASRRISILFLELLERQFPITNTDQRLQMRTASDFAYQLSIHVNHLNKALNEATQKTTSEIIADRILQEAKALLSNTHWNVSEIAYSLGFKEVTHFNNFFKKKSDTTPTRFRMD